MSRPAIATGCRRSWRVRQAGRRCGPSRSAQTPRLAGAGGSSGVASYLLQLTPVLLRADTRVTDHRFVDGQAVPFAAILQAGTAVLVDPYGVPRVRCASASPLAAPSSREAEYTGSPWRGFAPTVVAVVDPADASIRQFGLVDASGGQQFRRATGTAGAQDLAQVLETASLNGSYDVSGQQTSCDLNDCDDVRERASI